jgi:hypothetical protein
VNAGVVPNATVAEGVTLTKVMPVMPDAPMFSGRRSVLCRPGAGDVLELSETERFPDPLVVAGTVRVTLSPLAIGPTDVDAALLPTATIAAADAGSVGAGDGVANPVVGGVAFPPPPPPPPQATIARTAAVQPATTTERIRITGLPRTARNMHSEPRLLTSVATHIGPTGVPPLKIR